MRLDLNLGGIINTENFAERLGSKLKGGEVIAFASDLGGGKTTIIKSIVKGTGSKDLASSPTFTLTNTYKSPKFTIYHFDFYRLSDPGIMARELDEAVKDKTAVVLIEWPEKVESILPGNSVHINILVEGNDTRKLQIDYPKDCDYLFKDIT